jgi:3-oxoacyl-[acyl-carrier protein] reductase
MIEYQELSRSIAGKTAIITGAASGMGRATAHLFAREGANLVITDINDAQLERVGEEINQAGFSQVLPLVVDAGEQSQINDCVAKTVAQYGGIDIIVNNAGLVRHAPLDSDNFDSDWDLSLRIMLNAHQWMVRAALPYLEKSDSARIVNVASTEAYGAQYGSGPYSVAKHGVIGLTRSMAVELGRRGITANAICPGPIHTGITEQIKDEHKEIFAKRRVPMRRYGIPEEVAHMTLSCCLPAASFMTGATIVVDGGMLVKND